MAIFNSYVSLPEGIYIYYILDMDCHFMSILGLPGELKLPAIPPQPKDGTLPKKTEILMFQGFQRVRNLRIAIVMGNICICICICTYIYMYIHICIHIHIYICIHIYIYVFQFTGVRTSWLYP